MEVVWITETCGCNFLMPTSRKKKPKKYYVSYHKTRIRVPFNPRKGICVACGRKVGKGIKVTQIHHVIYAYITATVKKNPLFVLHNTIELCFACHRIADAFRQLLERTSYERLLMVFEVLPRNQETKMIRLCKKIFKIIGKRNI